MFSSYLSSYRVVVNSLKNYVNIVMLIDTILILESKLYPYYYKYKTTTSFLIDIVIKNLIF